MNEKKLYALTDDVVCYIKQGLQARASGFRGNGDVECAAHVQKIADALTPATVDDLRGAGTDITTPGGTMSITEERAALQEILADWKQADPEQVWDAFDFEDFNEMVGDLTALLAEVERLRAELAKTREVEHSSGLSI